MYEPITVEVDRGYGDGTYRSDRGYGDGTYRSHSINFLGRLLKTIRDGSSTMRLYEWADRGHLVYLVHVEEDKPGRLPRRTLYPFINTHLARATPTKGYTDGEVWLAYPEFGGRQEGARSTRSSHRRGRGHTLIR